MKTWIVLVLFLLGITPAFAIQVKVSEAPANDLALTVQTIETAQRYILLNIYELSAPAIVEALIDRIQAGVHVEILEEGQPAFGMGAPGKKAQKALAEAMVSAAGKNHFYVMTSKAGGKRRFRFDHAKYLLADDENLLIGSENYSPTGSPIPGKIGNRGWEVLIRDPELVARFKGMFHSDSTSGPGDVIDLMESGNSSVLVRQDLVEELGLLSPQMDRLEDIARGLPVLDADEIKPIVAPNNSLGGLLAMMDNAQSSIDLEQMTLDSAWGKPNVKSPLVEGLIKAARRGVQVRVLLNDESVFDRDAEAEKDSKHKNEFTVKLLNEIAKSEGLKLAARIADVEAMHVDYIHNKGALVDGNQTLVSSINWDENAVLHNREAAVLIQGATIYEHYEALFQSDWTASQE